MEEWLHHIFFKITRCSMWNWMSWERGSTEKVYNQCICDVDSKIIFQNELGVQT